MAPRKRKIKVVVPCTSPEKAKFSVVVIQTILNAQGSETNHVKLIKELKNIYPTVTHESFMRSFIQSLKGAMQHDETNEYANNRLKLCAKFIADPDHSEQEVTHPIIIMAFEWLLNTISPSAIVRFRICQFVNLVLNAMGPEASLDDDICDKILRYMLERMRDVAPNVRVQAVLALQRLQNPDDPEDCVFRTYIYHLDTDPSPKVRQTIISSLGRNYRTIPYIIERLWDVEERVRRHTYMQMSSYPVKQYKVAQRLTFLEQGLNDHSEAVRKVVKNVMIPQWFESYQKDYVAFVKALKIDADEKELERFRNTGKLALFEIFSKYGINDAMTVLGLREDDKTVPLENLTIETAICWQALLEFLQKTESDELDNLMVDLSTFCNYIKVFAENPSLCNYIRMLADDPSMITDKMQKMYFQSMLQILLEIVDSYDYGDEFGRETLKKILAEALCCCELDEDNVKIILSIFERLIGDVEMRFKFFVDLINSVLEPSRTDVSHSSRSLVEEYLEKNPDKSLQMKISHLRLTIMDLKEQEMEKVNQKDYTGAQKVAEQLHAANEEYATLLKPILFAVSSSSEGSSLFRESMLKPKKITNATINKCLQISFYLVNNSTVLSLTPIVCDLYKSFISRYVESAEIATRDWALRCSVAFSMLYDGLSKETFQLLYQQFFRNHCTRIWQTSIEGIFELMDHYGFEHFDVEAKKDEARKNTRQLFNTRDYLDQDDEASTSNTGTGVDLMRMMTHFFETCEDNVICSAIVDGFCRLILHGHCTSQDIMSKLLLKYFNPTTESKTQQILGIFFECLIKKKRQEILQKALLHTLFTILESPNDSPLQEVKPEHVLKFVIDSTKPVFCSPGLNPHNTIAISFLQVMLDNLNYKDLLKLLSKELLTLEISDDAVLKNDINNCIEQILLEKSLDVKIIKNLKDFEEMLQGTYRESLTFSSSRAPPVAIAEEHDTDHLSEPEEHPEVALEEEEPTLPKDPKEVPQFNKSSLQKDVNVLAASSPAKSSAAPEPVCLTVPQTPTTFGAENTTGMKSLRKSMNASEGAVVRNVFKVPDASAVKNLRQQQQKAAAEKKAQQSSDIDRDTEKESDESEFSEEEDAVAAAGVEESFAIPSTQDISGISTLDGDSSILHLEIPETQRPMEEQCTPIQRTLSKRKISDSSIEDEIVDSSPNIVTSRRDHSILRPLASAKSITKSQSAIKYDQHRTRNTALKEVISAKVMTRRSLTDVTSGSKGAMRGSLAGIEPLDKSPQARRRTRSSIDDDGKTTEKSKKKDKDEPVTSTVAIKTARRLELNQEKTDSAKKEAANKPKESAEKPKSSNKNQSTTATKKAEEAKTHSSALRTSRRNPNKDDSPAIVSSKKDTTNRTTEKKSAEKSYSEKTTSSKSPPLPSRTTRRSLEKNNSSASTASKTSTRSVTKTAPSGKSTPSRQKTPQDSPAASTSSTSVSTKSRTSLGSGSTTSVGESSSSKNPVKRTMVTRSSRSSPGKLSVSLISSTDSSAASPVRTKRTALTPLSAGTDTKIPANPTRPARKATKK